MNLSTPVSQTNSIIELKSVLGNRLKLQTEAIIVHVTNAHTADSRFNV